MLSLSARAPLMLVLREPFATGRDYVWFYPQRSLPW